MADKQTPVSFDEWASAGGGVAPSKTGFGARLGDIGLSLAKGAVAVPEAAVGAADLVTGGKAGKAAEKLGFRPKEAKEFLDSRKSDAAKDAQWRFDNAEGFTGKLGAAIENPSLIVNAVAESAPLMGAGGVVGRGIAALAPRAAGAAGAIGEGVVGAGSAAEQIRQQTTDGELTGKQAALAGATGVATGLLGMGGKYAAGKMGVGDIDQAIATGSTKVAGQAGKEAPGMLKRVGGGALAEGVLEELPQSLSEQALQNVALDKNWTQDLDAAAAMGLVTGGAMGAGMGVMSSPVARAPAPGSAAVTPPAATPPAQPAPVTPPPEGPNFGMAKTTLDERALYAAGVNPPAILDTAKLDGMLGDVPAPTFTSLLNTNDVYAGWSNVRDGSDREIMRGQMDDVAKMYGGKVTPETAAAADKELAQQFKWYRAASPEARQSALQALMAPPAPVKPSEQMGLNPAAGPLSAAAVAAVDGPANQAAKAAFDASQPLPMLEQEPPAPLPTGWSMNPYPFGDMPMVASFNDDTNPLFVFQNGAQFDVLDANENVVASGPDAATAIEFANERMAIQAEQPATDFQPAPQGAPNGTQANQAQQAEAQRPEAQPTAAVSPALGMRRPTNMGGKPTATMGTQTAANAGPGFDAGNVTRGLPVKQAQAVTPAKAEVTPAKPTPEARARNLATLKGRMMAGRKPGALANEGATPDVSLANEGKTAEPSLEDQLNAVKDELANQGMVKNARTRDRHDQLRTAIAERDFPDVLKAVDGNTDVAEAINRAFQFAGDESRSKEVVERVLKHRGVTDEYRKRWGERLVKSEGSADADGVENSTVYKLPEVVSQSWRRAERSDFEPSPRQQIVMDAVAIALDEGLFRSTDVNERVSELLGVSPEVRSRNRSNVEGGDFGYDVYGARKAVESQRADKKSRQIADEMNLKPGDKLGTLVANDFKRMTGVEIVSINESGLIATIRAKRGAATVGGEMGVDALMHAINRAHEKGHRKDNYADFIGGRSKPAKTERESRISTTLENGGYVVGDELRMSNGMVQATLKPNELASIPADKVRAKPDPEQARTEQPKPTQDAAPMSEVGQQWTRSTTTDREGMAVRAGLTPKAAKNLSGRGWSSLDPVAQENIERGMAKPTGEAAATPNERVGTVSVPATVEALLTQAMESQKGRITRLRNQAKADGTTLEERKAANLKVIAAEATLRKMRTGRFDAEDAIAAAMKSGNAEDARSIEDLYPRAFAEVEALLAKADAMPDQSFTDFEQALQSKSHATEAVGDVGIVAGGGVVRYVAMSDAIDAAQKAIASGVKAVPFQIHNATGIRLGDVDGVLNAMKAESVAPVRKTGESEQAADLDAMFDDVLAEEMAKDDAKKPVAAQAEPEDDTMADPEMAAYERGRTAKTRATDKARVAKPRTAGQATASAAKNTASALTNAIDGLGALFGQGPNADGSTNLNSGIPVQFSAETYAKAKPLFKAAVANLGDAGRDMKEAMRAVVRMVMDKFGAQAALNMKPYVTKFTEEYRDGKLDDATKAETLTGALYQAIKANQMPKDNPALKKLVEAFDGKPASPERMKQAQEELETAIAMMARELVAKKEGDRSTFDMLLRLYESQPNLNIRTSTSIANQAYSTPAPLAYLASRLAGITKSTVAHEPTGGTGMLLIGADPKKAIVNELNDLRIEALKSQGFAPTQKDAATQQLVPEDRQPDAVVTNPPFGSIKDADGKTVKVKVDGFSLGQIDHLIAARALNTMKPDGRGTLILGANKVAGGLNTDDRIFFNWLYSHYNVVGHFEIEGDLYNRQGAGWPVRVITINGRVKSNKISPVAGIIQRVNNWDDVYEQFTQSLAASKNQVSVIAPTADDGAGARTNGAVAAPSQAGQGRPAGGAPGAGNVAGTRTGALPDSPVTATGTVGGGADEQRLNAQSFVPATQPGQSAAGTKRPEKPAGTDAVEQGNEFQSPYIPRSARKDEGVLIPANMAQPTQDALSRLEDEVGDIDEFARKELGYDTVEDLHTALMGLQVDSVATSIYQIKQGKAVVIADQTGIGKGRQAASIIRWAAKQGMTPVFVSVKPSLFTDMYGDLADIGTTDVEPFIMNSDAWIAGDGGSKLFANKPTGHKNVIQQIANSGELPDGRNAVFMTYSQINTANVQRQALMALAPNAVFILDESHNAAGASATGDFVVGALDAAKGVVYLSATYAKRPDNMPLYFKTDIGDAAADTDGLAVAMASGGLPLQTVVSNNLVKAGQMFRRERSYDGVSIASVFDSKNRELHEGMSNEATKALRAIVAADRMFHEVYVKQLQDELDEIGSVVQDSAGNQIEQGVQHTEFSSVVHNFVKQMLLGLKAQSAADEAIASLNRGEKPIIAVENTMGSFLTEYAAANGIAQGDSLGSFDYRTVLSRALTRSRVVIEVAPNGDKVKRQVSLSQLDAATKQAYKEAQDVIDGLNLTIPVSPIDWMRSEIVRAGFKVAEITGRNLSVDYGDPKKPLLSAIDTTEQKDKVNTTRQFNSGNLDALILNVAGSTGISLHASEKFDDQRQRHMIVAQAAGDINIFMQMLGRVHRTGQVRLPKYTILSVDLPTEKRPTAVLSIKMKSLNANTSSNTESATSVKASDILNKYGDQIVHQYLNDNYQLARALDLVGEIGGTDPAEDIARKATGRLALQPIEVQMGFYEEVESQYEALIDYLNKTNQNDLEPRTFDFDAKEKRQEVLFDGPNKDTPFGADAIYGEYSIKAQGEPMKPAEIKAAIAENLGGKTGPVHANALVDTLLQTYADQMNADRAKIGLEPGKFDEAKYAAFMKGLYGEEGAAYWVNSAKAAIAKGQDIALMTKEQMANVQGSAAGIDFIRTHPIGKTFRVDINSEPFNAVITNIRSTHKTTGNPFSLSKIQVTVAVNGALRSLSIPATQFRKIEVSSIAPGFQIEQLFKEQPPNQRETAKIITGNLLAAYGELQGVRGTIITFTKEDGTSEQGILLPKLFDYSKNTRGDYRLQGGQAALKFLQESENKDIGRFGIMTRDGEVRVLPAARGIRVQVPKSKLKGAKYFLDKGLIAIGGDFVSQGSFMVSVVYEPADAAKMLDALMKKQALYALPSMAEEAKAITGGQDELPAFSRTRPVFSRAAQGQASNVVQGIVDSITARWANAPKVVVAFDMDDPAIPERVRQEDQRQRSGGATGTPEGFYYKGAVYLMSSKLADPRDVVRVLFHEALGHYGLRGVFGKELKPLLQQIATMRRAQVEAKMKEYGLRGVSNVDRLVAAEEVLAEMAQDSPQIGFVRRAIATIKAWLRKHIPGFMGMKMTDDEIITSFILPARNFVLNGGPNGGPGGGVLGSMPRLQTFDWFARLGSGPGTARQGISDAASMLNIQFTSAAVEDAELGAFTPAAVNTKTGAIHFNPAFKLSRAQWAQVMAEEIMHGVDLIEPNKTISSTSQRLASGGDVRKELMNVFSSDRGLADFLSYPLAGQYDFSEERIQAELFARLAVLYHGDQARMQRELPISYEAFNDIFGTTLLSPESRVLRDVRSARSVGGGTGRSPQREGTGLNGRAAPGNTVSGPDSGLDTLRRTIAKALSASSRGGVIDADDSLNTVAQDQGNPDIRFSRSIGEALTAGVNNVRDLKLPAGYMVNDFMRSSGKLNWWHKTVGTQYNLAQKSPAFKRVFDTAQGFLNDVSHYASEAANKAPTLLPKLETLKDLGKQAISAADNKAIAAPIFEGTLVWGRSEDGRAVRLADENDDTLEAGVVFTPDELRLHFELNDSQIALYQEFRAATDKSLTNMGLADMVRFGGKDLEAVAQEVLAAENFGQALAIAGTQLRAIAKGEPKRAPVLLDTIAKMAAKANKYQGLMDKGYAPLSRFGRHTLDVVDEDGKRVYFGLFESEAEANKMARQMRANYPGAQVSNGTTSEEEHKLFAGVSPETVELFGEMLGLEGTGDEAADMAFQQYLKVAKASRSSMKRLIHRKGIAGFSEDPGRVLAGFVYSNARQTSSAVNMGELTQAVADIPKGQGELKDHAVRLHNYVKNPVEEAQAFRGLLFAQYIGGSVASAIINTTQPFAVTMPWLSQFGGAAKAAKQMGAAAKDALKGATGDAALDKALLKAAEDGIVSPQEVFQLQAQAAGRATLKAGDGTKVGDAMATASNAVSKLGIAWGQLFGLAEQFNRRTTFIAAYRTAVEQGMADPAAFAERAISETQFIYSKANKPRWARGAVGSTLFTFKQYSVSYVELMTRLATSGPEGRKAAMLGLAILFLLSGAGGLPFAEDVDDLIDGIMQRLGYNFSTKQAKQEFFAEILGDDGAKFMMRGVSGLAGVPVDVSGRFGMGNLIPSTGLLTKKTDYTRDVVEIFGPAGDMVPRMLQAGEKLVQGEVLGARGALATAAPVAGQNLVKAMEMANTGMYLDKKGRKVLDVDGYDAAMKAIGFQPNQIATVQDATFDQQRMVGVNRMRESEIADKWARGLFLKDAEMVANAREDLAQWNADNPHAPIRVNLPQIFRRLRDMNMTKAERVAKAAPQEVRARVRAELLQP